MAGRQQDFCDQAFLADFKGLYDQHASMWPIYIDSLRILVTVCSAPLLGLAALLAAVRPPASAGSALLTLGAVIGSPVLGVAVAFAMLIICVINLLLLGVVIHHRLAILLYARGLNGYRKLYTQAFGRTRLPGMEWPFPVAPGFPENYEPFGPMGLIVTACGLVNGCYAGLACNLFGAGVVASVCGGASAMACYHLWYRWSCVRRDRDRKVETGGLITRRPGADSPPWYGR
jgi:hypothetical protein